MLGRIVDSTLSPGDDLFFFEFFDSCDLFVGFFNFLDVTSVLFAIEIVLKLVFFVFVVFWAETEGGQSGELSGIKAQNRIECFEKDALVSEHYVCWFNLSINESMINGLY